MEKLGRLTKLSHRISVPLELRLPNTTIERRGDAGDDGYERNNAEIYHLFAMVVHIGTAPTHGHYVTLVRGSGAGTWMLLDDKTVDGVDSAYVARLFGSGGFTESEQELQLHDLEAKVPPIANAPPSPPPFDLISQPPVKGYGRIYEPGTLTSLRKSVGKRQSPLSRSASTMDELRKVPMKSNDVLPAGTAYILLYELR